MKLLYFSSGPRERVLSAILDAGHTIEKVYVTNPSRWPKVRTTIRMADENAIPVRVIERHELDGLAEEVRGKTCVSVGFGYVISKTVIMAAREFLNVHGTLLPKFRGARTLNWVIASGEKTSGVTVHLIDESADTGPILLQRQFPISRFDTVVSLARKTYEIEPSVVVEALGSLESGKAQFTPQQDVGVRQFPNRRPEHSEVDSSVPLSELYDLIRACDPDRFPAYFYIEGEKICINLRRFDKPADEVDMI